MKKLLYIILGLFFVGASIVSAQPFGGGIDTINTLDVWTTTSTPSNTLIPRSATRNVRIPSLGSTGNPCVKVSSIGLLSTTTCGGDPSWTAGSGFIYNSTSTDLVGIGTSTKPRGIFDILNTSPTLATPATATTTFNSLIELPNGNYLAEGQTYGIRVYAIRQVDGITQYSSTYRESAAVSPSGSSPMTIDFSWSAVVGASGYRVFFLDPYYLGSDYSGNEAYYDTTSTSLILGGDPSFVEDGAIFGSTVTPTATTPNFYVASTTGFYYDQGSRVGFWSASSTDLNFTSGNVGIGTNSPLQKLHVNGSTKIEGILTLLDGNDIVAGYLNTASGSAGKIIYGFSNTDTGLAGNHIFGTSNSISGGTTNSSGVFGDTNITTASKAFTFGRTITNSIADSVQLGTSNTSKATLLSTGEFRAPFFSATTTAATSTFRGNLYLVGGLRDGAAATGTLGQVLQTTGTSTQWVATSSLGITNPATWLIGNGFLYTSTSTDAVKAAYFTATSTVGTSTFTNIYASNITATTSAGVDIDSINGTDVANFGTGSSQNSLFFGGVAINQTLGVTGVSTLASTSVSGYLGIGTTTPTSRMSLAENSGRINFGVPTSGFGAIGFSASTQTLNNSSLYGNGTNTYLNAPTGGGISMRINNTQVASADATVGFTVTAPDGNGLTITTPGFTVFNFNSASGGVFRNNTGTFFIDQQANAPINFRLPSGQSTLYLENSTYEVGVFDASPDFRLETTGSSGNGFFGITNSTDGDILTVNSFGSFGIGSTTPNAKLAVVGTAGSTTDLFKVASSTNTDFFTVKSSGNIGIGTTTPTQALSVIGNINIPLTTSSSVGAIYQDNQRLLHSYGGSVSQENIFLGLNAGNFTMNSIARQNVGLGTGALASLSSGAVSNQSSFNMAIGYAALNSLTTGQSNVGVGVSSLRTITTQSDNVGIGDGTYFLSLPSQSIAIGARAGRNLGGGSGTATNNVSVGYESNYNGLGSLSNAIAIGASTQSTRSNQAQFGNSSIVETILRGNVSIGTSTPDLPTGRLHITGVSGATTDLMKVASSTMTDVFTIKSNGRIGVGTSTPTDQYSQSSTATTTVFWDSTSATQGTCLVMKDADGAGYTYIVANNGVLTASTASCR